MTRIWRYVLKWDNGMAPCVQDGMLSLTVCKPRIRLHAERDDWVIGFLPKDIARHRGGEGADYIAWAGQVDEILSLGDYQLRHPNRRDAIYCRTGWHRDGTEHLKRLLHLKHVSDSYHRDRSRDWYGKNALLFSPFWYWGEDAREADNPDIKKMAHHHVGEATKDSTPERVKTLEKWLKGIPPGCHGKPRDPPPEPTRNKLRAC
jgi:hypothetical protein